MARLKINPTRMALSELKRRLKTSSRGYKLLKDKQDELMRQFIDLIKKNKELRLQVEDALGDSFKDFLLASAIMSPEMLDEAVSVPKQTIAVEMTTENVMSVNVPKMEFHKQSVVPGDTSGGVYPYGYAQTTSDLDEAIDGLDKVMDQLLELAQVEKAAQLMADEIEKTRRRVNALEYRTIPDLEETIKYIRSKLDENERSTITRLMKVKDMISKE